MFSLHLNFSIYLHKRTGPWIKKKVNTPPPLIYQHLLDVLILGSGKSTFRLVKMGTLTDGDIPALVKKILISTSLRIKIYLRIPAVSIFNIT